ncbi:MAG: HAMP domain-containing sensor histidine kinase [Balneolaceae bacterium]
MQLQLHRMYTDVLDDPTADQTGAYTMDPIQFLVSDHPDPIFIMEKATGRITRTNQEGSGRMATLLTGQLLNGLIWFCEKETETPYAFYDGQWYQSHKQEITLDGTEQLIVILKRRTDVPDRDSFDSLKQVTATLLHRLRSPLNGAQGYLEMIGDELTSKSARRRYNRIQDGFDRTFDIMDELELLNQVPAGGTSDGSAVLANPEKIVEEIRFQVSQEEGKRIRFISKGNPPGMLCDPVTLRKILAELIRNGLEHTGRGDVLIETVSQDRLRVSNGGEPIPGELARKIFYPFVTRKVNSLGIGLTRAYILASSQRGTLFLDRNSTEAGVSFTFQLPPTGW